MPRTLKDLSESKNTLEKIWMRARFAKQIQSKELIEARIKEYKPMAEIEAGAALYDAKRKARAQEELDALKIKADMLESALKVERTAAEEIAKIRFNALSIDEQKLQVLEDEIVYWAEQKKIAKELLLKLKSEKLALDWRKKQQTKAAVRNTIEVELDDELPPSYDEKDYYEKCELIYLHISENYYGDGQSIYTQVMGT